MNEWNKLSMKDRAAYIKLGIDSGITDLTTIRDTYNKYAEGGYIREKNNNPIAFDEEGNLVDLVTGEKGTMMLPEFTVRGVSPETRAKNYSSAYHPEDALEFLDIMTRPLTRPFSASLLIGAIRNKINGGTYLGSLLGNEENLGIVSKQFNLLHPYLSMGANMLADVSIPLDILGIKIANQLRPTNLRKHLYVNRIPFTYEGLPQLAKDMAKSILSGNTPDINAYPSWYNESVILQLSELYKPYGLSGEDVIKARDDAFRLYLKFPQRNGTFTPYINDIYPKQTNRIFTDKNGVSKLKEIPKQIIGDSLLDFVNSVGGGIGVPRIDIIDTFGDKTYGITRTSDVWDLHPFSRKKDRFIEKVIRPAYNKKIRPIIEVPYNKLRNLSLDVSYDTQAIKDYIAKHPEEAEFGIFDPDMFPSKHYKLGLTIKEVNDKILGPLLYPKFEKIKWLKKLDDKIASFEIGKLIGAEPFEVRYDIPWTKSLEISPKGEFYKKYIKGWDLSDNLPTEAYRFKKDNSNLDYKINK